MVEWGWVGRSELEAVARSGDDGVRAADIRRRSDAVDLDRDVIRLAAAVLVAPVEGNVVGLSAALEVAMCQGYELAAATGGGILHFVVAVAPVDRQGEAIAWVHFDDRPLQSCDASFVDDGGD